MILRCVPHIVSFNLSQYKTKYGSFCYSMWHCDPENTLIHSCVAMVTEIIAPHGHKEPLVLEEITHEGMVSEMFLMVYFINEYILFVYYKLLC